MWTSILSILSGAFKVFNFFAERLKTEEARNEGRVEQANKDREAVDSAEAEAQKTRKQSENMSNEDLDKDLMS